MKKIITFGEIMLRLKAPGSERFFQSPSLEATFGGREVQSLVGGSGSGRVQR
jgi:2-dehydro-3-deoxygluconokinase